MKGIFGSAVVFGLVAVSYVACSSGGGGSTPLPTTVYKCFAYEANTNADKHP